MSVLRLITFALVIAFLSSCNGPTRQVTTVKDSVANSTNPTSFGKMKDGREVMMYSLKNRHGVQLDVINYGGIIVSLKVPDRNGVLADVVLGYDSLESYERFNPYFGALIGRYGNRIANGRFTLDGREVVLAQNDGPNHLHGGSKGYDKVFWEIKPIDSSSVKLSYRSAEGDEGYPGNLDIEVTYSLTEQNELRIDYAASTDRRTVVNLTQHTYFNLAGHDKGSILDHELQIDADAFLPVDKTLIPTGEIRKVNGTPFDFLVAKRIGTDIEKKDDQLIFGKGFDHCWVLNGFDGTLRKVAVLYEKSSGRRMEVLSTEPGLQFYSGNFLDGKAMGKGGVAYGFRHGLCLETQHYPDSPNKKEFPSVVLDPGKQYTSTTVYRFSAE
jgi:aldose 1-epimerase